MVKVDIKRHWPQLFTRTEFSLILQHHQDCLPYAWTEGPKLILIV